jgi:hypothetical protein
LFGLGLILFAMRRPSLDDAHRAETLGKHDVP